MNWFIRDAAFENLVPNSDRCPAMGPAIEAAESSPDMMKLANQDAALLKSLNDIFGALVSALWRCCKVGGLFVPRARARENATERKRERERETERGSVGWL
jgi:hypothetical protein